MHVSAKIGFVHRASLVREEENILLYIFESAWFLFLRLSIGTPMGYYASPSSATSQRPKNDDRYVCHKSNHSIVKQLVSTKAVL